MSQTALHGYRILITGGTSGLGRALVADLVHRAFVGAVPTGPVVADFAILVGWALLGGAVAAKRFQWLPPRRG